MNFLKELDKSVEPIYKELINHPFNVELAEGTLPEEKFRFYISQDTFYIGEYSRALAALASKAPSHEELRAFIYFAKEDLDIEKTLHDEFMELFNIQYPNEIAFATEAYSNFLLSTVAFKSYPEALAALLPCFWLYNKVASDIYRKAKKENKYQKWIDTYSGAEFDKTTQQLMQITDRLARENNQQMREKMKEKYIRSSRYEWLFVDSAYYLRYWKEK
ncbi:MAG: thiaminase II [Bacteroidota bacterium]|nr:thiaminase II [Bacteroidota bacterium]